MDDDALTSEGLDRGRYVGMERVERTSLVETPAWLEKAVVTMTVVSVPDEVYGEDDKWSDEPNFPRPEQRRLYRTLVQRMEAEAVVLPGMGTAIGMLLRNLARDYVVRVIADQEGGAPARSLENSQRMQSTFKLYLDQASRADLEQALRTEFVLGLITEQMKVLDGMVEEDKLRVELKEATAKVYLEYVESVQGRIGK